MGTTAGDKMDRGLNSLLESAPDGLVETVESYEPLEDAYRVATASALTVREATDTSAFPTASVITTASAR